MKRVVESHEDAGQPQGRGVSPRKNGQAEAGGITSSRSGRNADRTGLG